MQDRTDGRSHAVDKLVLQNASDASHGSGCEQWLHYCIRDEKPKYEWLAPSGCGNQLQFFKDTPKDYDAWNIDPGTLDAAPTDHLTSVDSVELVTEITLHPAIQINASLAEFEVRSDLSVSSDDQVDIENDIDWHESHVLLKAAFPLAAVGTICHLRNSLRHHRPADYAQQLLGESAV